MDFLLLLNSLGYDIHSSGWSSAIVDKKNYETITKDGDIYLTLRS